MFYKNQFLLHFRANCGIGLDTRQLLQGDILPRQFDTSYSPMNSRHNNVKRQRVKRQPFLVTIDKFQAPKFTVAILCAQNSKIYGLDFSKYIKSRIERYFTISTPGNAGYAYIYFYVSLYVYISFICIYIEVLYTVQKYLVGSH